MLTDRLNRLVDTGVLDRIRYSERPDLWDGLRELFAGIWPEYNLHGDVGAGYCDGGWCVRLHGGGVEWWPVEQHGWVPCDRHVAGG